MLAIPTLQQPTKGEAMSTTSTFGTQLIGQTEKTLNKILDRLLTGSDLDERAWVTLSLAVRSSDPIERDGFVTHVATATQFSESDVQETIAGLLAAQLLQAPDAGSPIGVTAAGRQLHARIRASVAEITERLWGDLPAEELEIAGRVLSTVLARANRELAAGATMAT
jgi:hypothetical protein